MTEQGPEENYGQQELVLVLGEGVVQHEAQPCEVAMTIAIYRRNNNEASEERDEE